MAGWDQYVTNLTSQGITHAGIFGADGSQWAASPSFPVCFFVLFYFFGIFIFCLFRQLLILEMSYRELFLHNQQAF
jgi:hypothetical protein